ncbi:MAG: HNH endonuclease [Dehalococcoidia bacterium]
MTRDDLQSRILDLSVWQRRGERAPHKPLLLLWALGRCAAGEDRLVSYEEVDAGVKPLLQEFGPPRTTYHTEYPFWYLRNDGLWEVEGVAETKVREGKASQPTKSELVRVGATGGLVPEAYEVLRADPVFLHQVASQLVDAHFPDSIRSDVLAAVGLDEMEVVRRRKRDPGFRAAVMVAYGYRCCVCDFDARLGNAPLAIEAAHIKWHQAGGPDRVANGLGLCALHHKLLDRGAFTLGSAGEVVVSELVNGGTTTEEALFRYAGKGIRMPRRREARPDDSFIEWHRGEVFRGR